MVMSLCCGCSHPPTYQHAREFEAEVGSWNLVDRTLSEASDVLLGKGFTCDGAECFRFVGGFPCVQHQSITLLLSTEGIVKEAQVRKLRDGQLPSSCA